jgi:hypothetical protein
MGCCARRRKLLLLDSFAEALLDVCFSIRAQVR